MTRTPKHGGSMNDGTEPILQMTGIHKRFPASTR